MNENRFILANWGFTKEHWREIYFDTEKRVYISEIFLKTNGGILNYYERERDFNLNRLIDKASGEGIYSPRPYLPGQACDGTIEAPVLALFHNYCTRQGINPQDLIDKAYPLEKDDPVNFDDIILFARWQGVFIPFEWNKAYTLKLLDSLTEINYHSLVSVISDMIMV